jgi:hypothetical protein
MMLVSFPRIPMFNVLKFSKISLKYANLGTNVHCENVQHVLDFPLLNTMLLLLVSCKHEPQNFLLIADENYSKTGPIDTVPPFARIILRKVWFTVDKSLCSLQFWSLYPSLHLLLGIIPS